MLIKSLWVSSPRKWNLHVSFHVTENKFNLTAFQVIHFPTSFFLMVSFSRSGGTDACKQQFVAINSEIHRLAPWLSICKYDLDENLSTGGVYGHTFFPSHEVVIQNLFCGAQIYSTEI